MYECKTKKQNTNSMIRQKSLMPYRNVNMTENSGKVCQRVIYIDGCKYTHGSKLARELFDHVVVPYFDENGYRIYGILSHYFNYIKNNDREFNQPEDFLEEFVDYLSTQVREIRGTSHPVLVQFDPANVCRPAWPSELKEHLKEMAAHSGTTLNIRHVVRNATLKAALLIFCDKYGHDEFINLARQFNLEVPTFEMAYKLLYKTIYLNRENLWAGDGMTNQIIGFLSTFFYNYGENVSNGEEFDPNSLYEEMLTATRIVRGDSKRKVAIVKELFDIACSYIAAIQDTEGTEFIGSALMELGINFGFDFIDDYSDMIGDGHTIAERQAMLIRAESDLQNYIGTEGDGDLGSILSNFLMINNFHEEEETDGQEMMEEPEEEPENFRDDMSVFFVNNCLITAITNAVLGRNPTYDEIVNIRLNLSHITPPGTFLDGGDYQTILIITQILGIDIDQDNLVITQAETGNPITYGQNHGRIHTIYFDTESAHFTAQC